MLEEVKSESSDHSCIDENTDYDFDIGHESYSSCDSEREQESPDKDTGDADLFDSHAEENSNMNAYLTSGNGTKWSHSQMERSNVRTGSKNTVRILAGVKPVGRNAITDVQCWKLFVTNKMPQDGVK